MLDDLAEYTEYGCGLLFLNLSFYVSLISTIFLLFMLIFTNTTLNTLKYIGVNYFILFSFIILLLSLAGIPPLVGFLGKFLYLLFLLAFESYFLFYLCIVLNLVVLYFYIQNLRFLITSEVKWHTYFLVNSARDGIIFFNILSVVWFHLIGLYCIQDIYVYILFYFNFI